jgi:hypothetical protein
MMTRNRLLFAGLFVASVVFLYFYGGKIPYLFFNLLLGMFSISLLYTIFVFFRFKFTQDIDKKLVMKGDKVNFLFTINNEDFLIYPYLKVTFYGANTVFARQFQTKSFSLLPRSKRTFAFELECKFRGYYEVGIQSVEIEDFLGLFRFTYKINETKYLTVYPRIVYLNRFKLQTNFLSETNTILDRKYEDMTTISDLRKYAFGDSIKKIHWKLTAKNREIMVKNYQSTSETSAIFVLDLRKNNYITDINYMLEDKVIESVVAAIYFCLSNWIPVNLVYFKDRFTSMEAKNPLGFDEIYKTLSRLNFLESVRVTDILDIYLTDNINSTNFVIFTSNVDYDLYEKLYKAKFAGNEVSLVYVSPDEMLGEKNIEAENILNYLPEININTYQINIEDDIKAVLER